MNHAIEEIFVNNKRTVFGQWIVSVTRSASRRAGHSSVVCTLLLFCIVGSGCWFGSDDSSETSQSGKPKTPKDTPRPKKEPARPSPMLEGWEKPAFALLLTGEQHGYIEPCGCSDTQSGGLSRRGDLVQQLRDEKGWETVGFDLGGALKRSRRQSELKLETIRKSLSEFGYAAMALGPEELRLDPGVLISMAETGTETAPAVPFLAANVTLIDPSVGIPIQHKVVEIAGKKVGVTAVLGASYRKQLFPEGDASPDGLIRVGDPAPALAKATEALKNQQPDLMVLMSHCSVEETEALVKQFPDFNLVLTAGGPEDGSLETKTIGQSLVVDVGHKGKYVGVVGYYPDADEKLKFERVELDKFRFKRIKSVEERMEFYQDQLRVEDLAAQMRPVALSTDSTFVGAKKCGECHTKAYQKWSSTKHAKAFESIKEGRGGYEGGHPISRIHDPECLACHVTGWDPQGVFPYESGYVSLEKTPHLVGQQCENCHGAGSKHSEYEQLWKSKREKADGLMTERKRMHLERATAEQQVCTKCHDYENSPKFEFDKYWQEVWHPWRD